MNIKARNIKKSILTPTKKLGVRLVEGGQADQALTRGSQIAAETINKGEKQLRRAKATAKSVYMDLRAKIHAATAPDPERK